MNYKVIGLNSVPSELLEAGVKKYYKKNEILLEVGEEPTGILILLKGTVLTVTDNSDGDTTIVNIFEPLIPLFDLLIFNHKKILGRFICYSDVEVLYIDKQEITNLKNNNSIINDFFLETAYYKMNFLVNRDKFNLFNGEQRVYIILLEFAVQYGIKKNEEIKINFKISQQFISNVINVNVSTTARAITKLKKLGILEFRDGFYYIKKMHLLENICSTLK